jgi:beta-glucosidase
LVGAQARLVRAIIDTGVPTVIVLSSGKPVTEPWISTSASAVVQQFYPGQDGALALAEVLFGYNPSGRLSISFPQSTGSLPVTYDYLSSGRGSVNPGRQLEDGSLKFGRSYVLGSPSPWYEFGYGLSYSIFEYSDLRLSQSHVRRSDTVSVLVEVSNASDFEGQEVVQVYMKDLKSSVVTPNKQLKAFEKVWIKARSSETVKLDISVESLGLWNVDMKWVVEPGRFAVEIGHSSLDIRDTVYLHVE